MKDYLVILSGSDFARNVHVRAKNEKGAVRRAILKTELFGKWNNASVSENKFCDWVDITPNML